MEMSFPQLLCEGFCEMDNIINIINRLYYNQVGWREV